MNTTLLTDHDLVFAMALTVVKGNDGNLCLLRLAEILKAAVEAREQGGSEKAADKIDFSRFTEDALELAEGHFIALMAAFKGRKLSVQFCTDIVKQIMAAQAQRGAIGRA